MTDTLKIANPVLELGVNIDHVATLRNARGTIYPDPVKAALLAETAGADGITLHLREDRRHIRDEDVREIRLLLKTRMNLESAITNEMLDFACEIAPQDVCLVPEKREELTTEGGLDIAGSFEQVKKAVAQLQKQNIQVSLFIDPDREQIQAARETGAKVIELHTGAYAEALETDKQRKELERIKDAVTEGIRAGFKVNAGHGLHYTNVQAIAAIPEIAELNIGHAIVAHALFVGWENAIREMKTIMTNSRFSNMLYV